MHKIRVMVVDNSAFMRDALTSMISSDEALQVVGIARDGVEAVEKVLALKPDIVTMDVALPKMDGLAALTQIMDKYPVPVIMISSLTVDSAMTAIA
ncbi:MAG: response regulator, partial [Candidatus Magnetominusculus sp. LBB02]|nr:response regulator [Candidatus Magnetominusculus sp. LBB02]